MMMFSYIFLRLNRNKQGKNLAKWLKISNLFSHFPVKASPALWLPFR